MDVNYSKRIKRCFSAAYKALERYHGAGGGDFKAIADEFSEASKSDSLLCDLLVAVYGELSSEYRKREGIS
ncbi:MAG: hypothetical protein LBH28_03045 [Oscillospiraceae bacterium]|jgi:hypothetical protein|nr:hypothetical protein [Oscillospiraceae bacterium]